MKENNFTEIFKLKNMLDEANIKYNFTDRYFVNEMDGINGNENYTNYQIEIYNVHGERILSIIQGTYTFGGIQNLLEIMLTTSREEPSEDEVYGWLTAIETFEIIKDMLK